VSEKVTASFAMARAVIADAETAALAASSEHLHQLDSLRLEVTALTQENGELALEAARLRKQHEGDSAAAAELFRTTQRLRSERETAADEVRAVREMCHGLEVQNRQWQQDCNTAVAELAHVREQMAAQMGLIETAARAAANAVVYANVDTSLEDPRAGKLLVVRIDHIDARRMLEGAPVVVNVEQRVGWLEAAQDEGDTETKPVASAASTPAESAANDVRLHARLEVEAQRAIVRCGECASANGHFPDCAKAVAP
jgi:hypothetical protein